MRTTSWKTTVGGSITAFGLTLMQITDPPWVNKIAITVAAIGALITGIFGRDNDKTSSELGLHDEKESPTKIEVELKKPETDAEKRTIDTEGKNAKE